MQTSPDVSRSGVARPRRRVCHRATAGDWIRGVLEQYVAGADTRGRPEGRPYPRSQQAIREISGLVVGQKNLPAFITPGDLCLFIKLQVEQRFPLPHEFHLE